MFTITPYSPSIKLYFQTLDANFGEGSGSKLAESIGGSIGERTEGHTDERLNKRSPNRGSNEINETLQNSAGNEAMSILSTIRDQNGEIYKKDGDFFVSQKDGSYWIFNTKTKQLTVPKGFSIYLGNRAFR